MNISEKIDFFLTTSDSSFTNVECLLKNLDIHELQIKLIQNIIKLKNKKNYKPSVIMKIKGILLIIDQELISRIPDYKFDYENDNCLKILQMADSSEESVNSDLLDNIIGKLTNKEIYGLDYYFFKYTLVLKENDSKYVNYNLIQKKINKIMIEKYLTEIG